MKKVINLEDFNESKMTDNHRLEYIENVTTLKEWDLIITLLVVFNGVLMIFNEEILGNEVMFIGMILQAIFISYVLSSRYKTKNKIKSLLKRYVPKNESSHIKITYDFSIINNICLYLVLVTTVFMIMYLIIKMYF